ncbi:hypothetical protein ACFVIL_32875 [Streptomyces sp. NPDC127159]|uniref:hypothetical protein n=1 Tax=unclassified Streptomyces TaxID=2593676 RepID=UPI003636D350
MLDAQTVVAPGANAAALIMPSLVSALGSVSEQRCSHASGSSTLALFHKSSGTILPTVPQHAEHNCRLIPPGRA